MKKFLVVAILAVTSWFMVGGAVLAESPSVVYCGELPKKDCTILTDAVEGTTKLSSVSTSGSVTVLIENVPDAPVDTIDFELVASSVSSVDPDTVAALLKAQKAYIEEPAENMKTMLEATADVYSTTVMATEMTLNTGADVAKQISLMNNIEFPETVSISLVVADQLGYVDLTEVAPIVPDKAWKKALDGWHAVNLVELLNEFSTKITDSMKMSADDPNAMAMTMIMGDESPLKEFITVERMKDKEGMAIFKSSFDFAAFLGSPLFQEIVLTQMNAGDNMSKTELEELEANLTMMGFMAPVIVEGVEAATVRTIDLDNGYVHSEESYFNWDLTSLATIAGIVGADTEGMIDTENPPMVFINISSNYKDFNEKVSVSAPEEYLFYPTKEVMKALEESK